MQGRIDFAAWAHGQKRRLDERGIQGDKPSSSKDAAYEVVDHPAMGLAALGRRAPGHHCRGRQRGHIAPIDKDEVIQPTRREVTIVASAVSSGQLTV
jgi:hypothetical protein